MAWGAGVGGSGGAGGGRPHLPSFGAAAGGARAGGGGGVLIAGAAPGLPPRVSLHACVALCVAGFLLGRATTPRSQPPPTPPTTAAAFPLPTLPPAISALADADARHAALASAVASGGLNATALLPEMGPLGGAWLRQSGFLALRPPLPPAESGSGDYVVQPAQILSFYPRIVVFPNFVDAERRAHIMALAQARLQASALAWRPTETPDPEQRTRTSKGTFLSRADDPLGVVAWLEEKIAAVTYLPVSHGESFNVLKYERGQHYASHHDTFSPSEFGEQKSQRMATVLTYLSDVDAGGETIFKREGLVGHLKPVERWGDCSEAAGGYRYRPRAGDALLFFSVTPDGELDPRSLHGGCPVAGGREKWVATKWIHDKPLEGEGTGGGGRR